MRGCRVAVKDIEDDEIVLGLISRQEIARILDVYLARYIEVEVLLSHPHHGGINVDDVGRNAPPFVPAGNDASTQADNEARK